MRVFRSASQDKRHQYDYWHDLIEQSYAICDGRAADRTGFDAEIAMVESGGAALTEVRSPAVSYSRRHAHIRSFHSGDVFVSLIRSGRGMFCQNGRQVDHHAGSILLYDSARPYEFVYPGDYRSTLLRVPRALLVSRMNLRDDFGGTVMSADSAWPRLIRSVILNLADLARDEDLTDQIMSPALDMIGKALAAALGAAPGEERSRLRCVQRYMVAHLADEGMTLNSIADAQGLSTRSLGRLFAAEGLTPMGWLQTKRLAAAYARLAEGRARSVTDVAFDCGFGDLSNFGRAFRKEFGTTPRRVMAGRRALH